MIRTTAAKSTSALDLGRMNAAVADQDRRVARKAAEARIHAAEREIKTHLVRAIDALDAIERLVEERRRLRLSLATEPAA